MTNIDANETAARVTSTKVSNQAMWRILDANLNRALEGLRVIEDYLRFIRNDPLLSQRTKTLRHDLVNTLRTEGVGAVQLYQARDIEGDVGTQNIARDEYDRDSRKDMLEANFQRIQQSTRCLEEYSKLFSPTAAGRFESLRYESYALGRLVFALEESSEKLKDSRLYLIVDASAPIDTWEARMRHYVELGVDIIQLRDKNVGDRELLTRACLLREITDKSDAIFVMNDRPDLAHLSGADGIHVGQDELQVRDVRQVVGPDMLIGVSTHSLPEARKAVLDGADYIGVGPVFKSNTKGFDFQVGTSLLREVRSEIALPAFAIGGIDLSNIHQVTEAGFVRVAVSGAVRDVSDPADVIRRLRQHLGDQGASETREDS